MCEIFLGINFSNQIRSIRFDAELRLDDRSLLGINRCVVVGKYPREVENCFIGDVLLGSRLLVSLFSSRAVIRPSIVIRMAVIFR